MNHIIGPKKTHYKTHLFFCNSSTVDVDTVNSEQVKHSEAKMLRNAYAFTISVLQNQLTKKYSKNCAYPFIFTMLGRDRDGTLSSLLACEL